MQEESPVVCERVKFPISVIKSKAMITMVGKRGKHQIKVLPPLW